jgi:hypothetical protein
VAMVVAVRPVRAAARVVRDIDGSPLGRESGHSGLLSTCLSTAGRLGCG